MNDASGPSTRRRQRWITAEREHAKKTAAIQVEVEALEKRSRAEDARWDKEKEHLEAAWRHARG